MEKVLEDRIRLRAHTFWEQDGRPLGRDAEHWQRALQEIEREIEAERRELRPERAGVNAVSAANIYVHSGPAAEASAPGFGKKDGLSTPGVTPAMPGQRQNSR